MVRVGHVRRRSTEAQVRRVDMMENSLITSGRGRLRNNCGQKRQEELFIGMIYDTKLGYCLIYVTTTT